MKFVAESPTRWEGSLGVVVIYERESWINEGEE